MKILVLIRDLVLSSQIRSAAEAGGIGYSGARDNETFGQKLSSEAPETVVIDLNIQGADPFKAIEAAKGFSPVPKIVCFYSHVDEAVAIKAKEQKADAIFRRSIFFKDVNKALLG